MNLLIPIIGGAIGVLLVRALQQLVVNSASKSTATDLAKGSDAYQAAYFGLEEKLFTLLANGADVNAPSEPHGGAVIHGLFCGFSAGKIENHEKLQNLVEKMLNAGANIDATTRQGVTALHSAILLGQIRIVEMLVSRGANVNAQDSARNSPLMAAAACGQIAIVKSLLSHGANAGLKNSAGETPRDVARKKGYAEVALVLAKHEEAQQAKG